MSQSNYWVMLKNKNPNDLPAVSIKTIENRKLHGLTAYDETDLPIDKTYLSVLEGLNLTIKNKSKWLNAVSIRLTEGEKKQVKGLEFVKAIVPIDGQFYVAKTQPSKKSNFAPVMTQVEAAAFQRVGLTAKGITIGVIDAGFYEAQTNNLLRNLFEQSAILDKRDYVNPKHLAHFFTIPESYSDFHGTEVLTAIAGRNTDTGVQDGLATEAQFYLARTDHGSREWRGEEDNWIAAMEWMDSLGVRIINTSLGYAKGFTNPAENYEPNQMDGKTSLISRAAQIAVEKKGILLVVSAGNEGDDETWQFISTPADAEGVLAVGATNGKLWSKMGYSSTGPEFLSYLKPNVSCYSLMGTSLSAPVITGFAACLMQAHPKLSNKELKTIIEKSAHLYPFGNTYVGYGVPLASRALALAKNEVVSVHNKEIYSKEKSIKIGIGPTIETVLVFHKKDKWHVLSQEALKIRGGKLILKRGEGENQTTIDMKNEVIEVFWQ